MDQPAPTRPLRTVDRREVLQGLAVALGGALSPSVVSAVLSGCTPPRGAAPWTPETLTADQTELTAVVAELIIPATDTPGARAAGVHEFIDLMLTHWLPAEERASYLAGLGELDPRSRERHCVSFLESGREQQIALLQALEQQAEGAGPPKPFFTLLKELTLVGYYTSEVGSTQELRRFVGSAAFRGCVRYEEVGRAWAPLPTRRRL